MNMFLTYSSKTLPTLNGENIDTIKTSERSSKSP